MHNISPRIPRLRRAAAAVLCFLLAAPPVSLARVLAPIELPPAAVQVVPAYEGNPKGNLAPQGLSEAGASVSPDKPAGADPGDGKLSLASGLSCQPPASPMLDSTPRFHGGSDLLTPWGLGWSSDLDHSLVVETSNTLVWVDGNANRVRFFRSNTRETPPIVFDGPAGMHSRLTVTALTLGQPMQASLREKDGTVRSFARVTGDVVNPLAMTQLVDRNGNTLSYARDGANRLTRVQDVHGRFVDLEYDNHGFVDRLADSGGRVFTYTYDAQGHKLSETGPEGPTSYAYDGGNRISQITYPDGGVKNFTYDAQGRVLSEDDGGGINRKTYVYEAARTLVTDANGGVTTIEFVERDGLKKPSRVTDPENRVTVYAYDAAFNVASITDPLLRVTRFTYDAFGNVTATEDAAGGFTRATYEPVFNQPTKLTSPRNHDTLLSYDAEGNLLNLTRPLSAVTVNSYDAFGHVATTRDPAGKTTQFTYNPANGALASVTDPLSRQTLLQTDALSRVTRSQDPAGKATRYEYDTAGNLTKVIDADGGETLYAYEPGRPRKRLVSVTDAKDHETTFDYDAHGRLTATTNALGQSRISQYDDKGNLTRTTNARGQVINYAYDDADRLTSKSTPEGSFSYGYDAAGNLTSVSGPSGSVQMSYDALNRVTQVIQTIAGQPAVTIGYRYDANGNRTRMETPYGDFVYVYDELDRLTRLTNPQNRVFEFQYDAASRRTKLIYPNGIEARYVYDDAGQVTSIRHVRTSDGAVIAKAEYVYDQAGNRTSMTDLDGVHTYDYDNLHRLTQAIHPSTNTPVQHETFSYDAVGNRLADARITGYTYDDANRLISNSSFTYAYDADGNLTRKTDRLTSAETRYSYDSENRLVGVELPNGQDWTYKYDGLGRRVEKSSGTAAAQKTRYIYDQKDVLAELGANGPPTFIYTYHPRGFDDLFLIQSSPDALFIHSDGLNSITAVSNNVGAIGERISYSAFGQSWYRDGAGSTTASSPSGIVLAFTNRELDVESGHYQFRGRQLYDPLAGRFHQADPSGLTGGINLYAYVSNNPLGYIDPGGFGRWKRIGNYWVRIEDPVRGHRHAHIKGALRSNRNIQTQVTTSGAFREGATCPVPKDLLPYLRSQGFALGVAFQLLNFFGTVDAFQRWQNAPEGSFIGVDAFGLPVVITPEDPEYMDIFFSAGGT